MPMAAASGRYGFVPRTIEITTNIATLVVALLLSAVLLKNYLLPVSPARRPAPTRTVETAKVGTDLSKLLTGVNWSRNVRTLVLALSTHCHFCTESAPFFRQMRQSVGDNVKLVGVLPESIAESQSYLSGEGVHLDEVRQVPLYKLGVEGTPTMLLVNSKGIVTQTWVGRLAPDKQAQALNVIAGVRVKKGGGA